MQELEVQKKQELTPFSFSAGSLDEAMRYATIISESDLVPVKDYKGKPGNVLIAIQMGQELGLKPLQALQNIAVINGRPSLWGDAMLGIVKAHNDFEYIKEWQDKGIAYCTLKRRNEPEQTRSFSKEQAKIAGLLGKQGPWTTYPERMMQMRARSWCCRDVFPDALKGIHSAEESTDLPNENNTQKSNAEELNQFLVTQAKTNYEGMFEKCSTLDELKSIYTELKDNAVTDEDKKQLVHFKDLRKAELQAIEEAFSKAELTESSNNTAELNKSLGEWKSEYDSSTGELKS
jgi:hypothetical protein